MTTPYEVLVLYFQQLSLAFKLGLRDLRHGIQSFRIFKYKNSESETSIELNDQTTTTIQEVWDTHFQNKRSASQIFEKHVCFEILWGFILDYSQCPGVFKDN